MRPQRGWLDLRWGEPLGYAGRKDEARAQYQIASKLYVKSKLESTPLTEIPGLPAPLAVSSPEATALDLIAFSHRLGGIERALEVIQGLEDAMTGTGMRSALRSSVPVTVLQRIGYVFEKLKFDSLAEIVLRALPRRFPPALLQAHGQRAAGTPRAPLAIINNVQRRRSRK